MQKRNIFITGGTRYLGRVLFPQLVWGGPEGASLALCAHAGILDLRNDPVHARRGGTADPRDFETNVARADGVHRESVRGNPHSGSAANSQAGPFLTFSLPRPDDCPAEERKA